MVIKDVIYMGKTNSGQAEFVIKGDGTRYILGKLESEFFDRQDWLMIQEELDAYKLMIDAAKRRINKAVADLMETATLDYHKICTEMIAGEAEYIKRNAALMNACRVCLAWVAQEENKAIQNFARELY